MNKNIDSKSELNSLYEQDVVITEYGRKIKDLFYLDKNTININHGSYGAPPRSIGIKYHKLQEEMDANCDAYFRFDLPIKLNQTIALIADYIKADKENIVFVENASDGVNSVMKSMIKPNSKILIMNVAYGMVKNIGQFLQKFSNVTVIVFNLTRSNINNEEKLLSEFNQVLDNNPDISFASIDHISSVPSFILPIEELLTLLKKRNIITLIDGAHAVGQIDLDIGKLDPDFYVSNFHKWSFAVKSASFLYVRKVFQDKIFPNIISSEFNWGFSTDFRYTGTKDYSAFLSVKDSLEFIKRNNIEKIRAYNHNLAISAGKIISTIFNTDLLLDNHDNMGSITNVRLPINDENKIKSSVKRNYELYKTFIPVFNFDDVWYARFSCQIYNEEVDYEVVAKRFLQLLME